MMKTAVKEKSSAAYTVVAAKTKDAYSASAEFTSTKMKQLEPKLMELREHSTNVLQDAQKQWVLCSNAMQVLCLACPGRGRETCEHLIVPRRELLTSRPFIQVKLDPLMAQMTAWMQEMATCMCAPFGGAIAYRGMASNEYPSSVEAPDARAQ